jgi:hypothetical protein
LSVPVLSWLFIVYQLSTTKLVKVSDEGTPAILHPRAKVSRHSQVNTITGLIAPVYPTLRANPFPEVTDLFCRLPLPTLFYQLEAVHLGDLLRLWVRPIVEKRSLRFSRIIKSAPDKPEVACSTSYRTSSPGNLIPRLLNCKREKKTLSRAPADVSEFIALPLTPTYWYWNINQFPFRETDKTSCHLYGTTLSLRID